MEIQFIFVTTLIDNYGRSSSDAVCAVLPADAEIKLLNYGTRNYTRI